VRCVFRCFTSSYVCALRDLHSSLHDALPIFQGSIEGVEMTGVHRCTCAWAESSVSVCFSRYLASTSTSMLTVDPGLRKPRVVRADRKSTRLNSSHVSISYAVFCLKKKNRETR